MRRHWRLGTVVGCGGLLVLCLALPFIPYGWRILQLKLAQQRWAEHGSRNYTLIISRHCFCPNAGEYKLTIQDGVAVAVEPLGNSPMPVNSTPPFTNFSNLAVEAVLGQAERATANSWSVPWRSLLTIEYDPTYGYVTNFHGDLNGWLSIFTGYITDSGYTYTARDFQILP